MPIAWPVVPKDQRSPFRDDVLAGRVALVTGGGSGIGLEVARQLCKHGAKCVIMGRRVAFLDKAADQLRSEGLTVAVASGDIRKPADCQKAVQTAVDTFGQLDILVNNAAGNFLSSLDHITPNGFKTVIDIDTLGTFNMCHAAFEPLKRSQFGGNIIMMTATLHLGATWYQAHPSAAKAAVDSLSRSMALEWGEHGIRVNGIAPGPIADTPGLTKLSSPEKLEKTVHEYSPIRRLGTRFDIAMCAVFLTCDGGQNVSGHVLVCDGANWLVKPPQFPKEMVSARARSVEGQSRSKM
eukprot:TRINITY_DN1259_c16_g1_i1.p2 TRINITY_DN1259_c16_g1~~TRINITY_DN1259_c16_g1_i1.p2  ORF type:complete len:321 (+),score=109.03 TRINITY_DN1259_c16_g1_i1:79-963(+)